MSDISDVITALNVVSATHDIIDTDIHNVFGTTINNITDMNLTVNDDLMITSIAQRQTEEISGQLTAVSNYFSQLSADLANNRMPCTREEEASEKADIISRMASRAVSQMQILGEMQLQLFAIGDSTKIKAEELMLTAKQLKTDTEELVNMIDSLSTR